MNRIKNVSKVFIALVLISSLTTLSCKKSSDNPTPGPNQVFMENTAFTPNTLNVTAGTTVTWVNHDNMDHTVNTTTNVSGFASPGNGISPGSSYQFTFTTAGTYPYQCLIHSGMTGTVVVK